MKLLYLVRHAKSSWDDPFLDDFDRPLNSRGLTDAPRMAKRLKEKDIHPDILLSSPAQRAFSTSVLLSEKAGYPPASIHTDARLYHASDEQLLKIVHEMNDGNDEVMVVAHNPGLTDFVNRLSTEPVTDNIPTCGVVCIRIPVDFWRDVAWGKGTVVFFDFPKKK